MTTPGSGLVVSGVSKRYGATKALSNVSLEILPGQVVALIGHNGAGKSTLLRALAGAEVPNDGSISVDGRTVHFQSPSAAAAAGIACVYQELSLVNELTIAENLFLGSEKFHGLLLDRRAMNKRADELLVEYNIPASATDLVARLPVAQRQLLEVVRAINRDARYLLLDEPTTALEREQVQELLDVIRRLVRERGMGVLFINHKLNEVYAIADYIVGLANGEVVLRGDAKTVTADQVVDAIVGYDDQPVSNGNTAYGKRFAQAATDKIALEVRGLRGNGLNGIDLKVHVGEILGIYGLNGSGRSRFLRTVYGIEPLVQGEMLLDGVHYRPRGPERAIKLGIAFVPEERKSDGYVPQMTSVENIILPVLGRFMKFGILNWRRLKLAADGALANVPILGDVEEPITSLSGGNQQKALFARTIVLAPNVLLLDEPTKGVDIGAKAEIHRIIRNLAREGRSVVVVSSEEEELLEVSDRVVVFRHGYCDGHAVAVSELSVADLRRGAWASGA
jgi:ribose transport system ATP-binding protein